MKRAAKSTTLVLIAGIFCVALALALALIFVFGGEQASAVRPEAVKEAKAATAPTVGNFVTATPTSAPTATIAPSPTPAPTATPVPTATPLPSPTPQPKSPLELGLIVLPPDPGKGGGRWIDLNLNDGYTRLVDGGKVLKELPSAWGYGTTGTADDYFSTPVGLYFVYEKRDELHHDETYSTGYFRGWVGFDPERANGFHSFILDAQEQVIDARLGPVSHGCVRVGDWQALYNFAEVGMPVIVHGQYKAPVEAGKTRSE